jgi:hypothetical protein
VVLVAVALKVVLLAMAAVAAVLEDIEQQLA